MRILGCVFLVDAAAKHCFSFSRLKIYATYQCSCNACCNMFTRSPSHVHCHQTLPCIVSCCLRYIYIYILRHLHRNEVGGKALNAVTMCVCDEGLLIYRLLFIKVLYAVFAMPLPSQCEFKTEQMHSFNGRTETSGKRMNVGKASARFRQAWC